MSILHTALGGSGSPSGSVANGNIDGEGGERSSGITTQSVASTGACSSLSLKEAVSLLWFSAIRNIVPVCIWKLMFSCCCRGGRKSRSISSCKGVAKDMVV